MQLHVYQGEISSYLDISVRDYQLDQLIERFKRNHTLFDYMNRKKMVDQFGRVRMGPPPIKAVFFTRYNDKIYLPNPSMERLLITLH